MINRLRNVLNWAAFASILPFIFGLPLSFIVDGYDAFPFLLEALTLQHLPHPSIFIAITAAYLYPFWVLIQYVVWKEPVFLPWKFKVDEE